MEKVREIDGERSMGRIPITSWTREGRVWIDPRKVFERVRQQGVSFTKYSASCILCYQRNLVDLAIERYEAAKIDTVGGCDYYEFDFKGKRIGIIKSGIGSPMAAQILEDLIARGAKRVISTGIAGTLQHEGILAGDIVLCTKAVRNEGTSYHYQKPSKYSYPDRVLLKEIEGALKKEKMRYHKGPTITIDAPYQFTVREALRLRKEGVLTSEMEAAAIFAVAKFRQISAASLFLISDLATEDFEWNPQFDSTEVLSGYERLFRVCTETLAR